MYIYIYGGVSVVVVPHTGPRLSVDRSIFLSKDIRIHARYEKMTSRNFQYRYGHASFVLVRKASPKRK